MSIIYDKGPTPLITTCKLPTRRSPRNHANTYVEPYLNQYNEHKEKIKEDDVVEFVNKEDLLFGKLGRVIATHDNKVHVEVYRVTTKREPEKIVRRSEKDLQITELPKFGQKSSDHVMMNSNNKAAHKNLVTKKIGDHRFVFDVDGEVIIRRSLVKFIKIEDTHLGKVGYAKKIVQNKVLISILGPSDQFVWRIGDEIRFYDPDAPIVPTSICEAHHLGDSDSSVDKSYRSDSSYTMFDICEAHDLGDSDSSVDKFYWSDSSYKILEDSV